MRMKALGVVLMVAFAAFTTVYWIIDAPRRETFSAAREEELLEFGRLVFLPDDTFTITITITDEGFDCTESGFDCAAVEVFVNTSFNFSNRTGAAITVRGSGARAFEVDIGDRRSSPIKFDAEGETTISASGVDGGVLVTAGPPHLAPYGANCARCHSTDGTGGVGPNLHSLDLARKWAATGGAQGVNNYVAWVITLGGVVRSGNISSLMPAWGQEYGGSLTRQQIEAVTTLIGTWAQETLDNPPPEDVPNTVEAGAEVFVAAGCVACHGADLEGGIGPNLQTIGSTLVTEGLTTATLDLDLMQADYEAFPRRFLERWIRNSADYNGGMPTAMPAFSEATLSGSRLTALITFLLSHTE